MKKIFLALFLILTLIVPYQSFTSEWRIESPWSKSGTSITPAASGDTLNSTIIGNVTPAAGAFTQLKGSINTETLAANKTLLTTDLTFQWLDPNGADRTITLPAEALSTNLMFIILNTADGAGEDLVITDDTPTTIATLGAGMSGIFSCNGTAWKYENDSGIFYDKINGNVSIGTGELGGATISKQFSNKCAADLFGILTYPKFLYTWQGTPGNGLTESDLSGAGHTATYVGAGWAAADKVNKGFGFVLDPDGASYINLGDSDDFSFGDGLNDVAFSIGGIIEVVATATYQMVATKYDDTTGAEAREWQIYVSTDETLLILLIDESANVTCFRITDAALSAGFHTFAITCSSVSAGASRANDILIYVDGAVVASTATNNAAYVAMENLATPCWIGAREGASGTPEYYMQGDIGTLMIDKGVVWSTEDIWKMHLYFKSLYNL